MNPTLEVALTYASRGWHVFPLVPLSKAPITTHGLQDASVDPDVLAEWYKRWPKANLGIRTGAVSGIVVLDADNLETLAQFWGNRPMPKTPCVTTPRGGRHYFFKHPGVRVANSASKLAEGIDVRGDGGYVCAPPSFVLEPPKIPAPGAGYRWVVGPENEIAPLPEWLLVLMRPVEAAATVTVGLTDTHAPPDIIEAARQTLKQHGPAIQGKGGDHHTFAAAALLVHNFALTHEEAWPLITEWNKTCVPPWTDADLTRKLNNAAEHAKGPYGDRREPLVVPWLDAPAEIEDLPEPVATIRIDETDVGNARRFVQLLGQDARFVHDWGMWVLWNGTHWSTDKVMEIFERAVTTVEHIENHDLPKMRKELTALEDRVNDATASALAAGGGAESTESIRRRRDMLEAKIKALTKHAKDSKSAHKLSALIKLASTQASIRITSTQLDADPYLLAVANGTLNLRTGELRPSDRADLITKVSPITYDANAACQRWEQFLWQIFQGDSELISYLQRAVGYTLTGSVQSQVMFFLHGDGANGKSTFVNVVQRMLGPYATIGASSLMEPVKGGHPADIADIQGTRMVAVSETEEGAPLPAAQIKRLTSEEPLKARTMGKNFWAFTPTHKLWVSGNHKPSVKGADVGIWRRLHLVPFTYTVPKEARDAHLADRLMLELPGILTWAVRGCQAWREGGLSEPKAVREAIEEYKREEDTVGAFLGEQTERGSDFVALAQPLYAQYRMWAEQCGYRPLNIKQFKARVSKAGLFQARHAQGMVWKGIRARPDGPPNLKSI